MQTLLYDGTFEGWLSCVFDVYDYKFTDATISTKERYLGDIFHNVHIVETNEVHSDRVWKGLQQKISVTAQKQLYRTFLSEINGIENVMLQYVRYAFSSSTGIEGDNSNTSVLTIAQTAKKVYREKHRMEAFVRFQKTKDDLYYSIIEPDFNVLPLIGKHFAERYADQKWMIYDVRRKYGIFYDLQSVENVEMVFVEGVENGREISAVYDEDEDFYQKLWQQYFKSINIAARKNTKLHIQHMPKRYWKYLPEKMV